MSLILLTFVGHRDIINISGVTSILKEANMAVIKQYHKDTGITYAYESVSYWDAEKKQSRSKRTLLGKVDPDTGEIIPTGDRGRKKKKASDEGADLKEAQLSEKYKKMYEDSLTRIKELTILNKGLESENRLLTERNIRMASVLDKLRSTLDSFTENKK